MPVRAAILAGGQASRMGGARKGLAPVGGRRIVDRLLEAARAAGLTDPLLVTADPEAPAWGLGPIRIVPDARPGSGTLGGIYTAVAESPAPVVVLGWDLPFVPPGLLRRLAQGLDRADVVLPASPNALGFEPLCAAYGPAVREPIAAALDEGDFRAVAFHDRVRVGILSLEEVASFGDPALLFLNVNTPADLDRAQAIAARATDS